MTLNELSNHFDIVIPLHPRTKSVLENQKIEFNNKIRVINPVGYLDMISLIKNCSLVMTDSGGLQKEAYFFKKLCITLRNETEWIELVENEYNFLVGTNQEKIISLVPDLINKDFVNNIELYGDGKTAKKIIDALRSSN